MRFFFIALLLICCTAVKAQQGSANFPADFTATFELYKSGLMVAETEYRLNTKQQPASFQSTTRLKGLLSLFSKDSIHEKSSFDISSKEGIKLRHYQFLQTGDHKKTVESSVDWETHIISSIINEQAGVNVDFDQAIWDNNTVLLALMSHASENKKTLSFNTLNQDEMKSYTFLYLGQKEIELDDDEWKVTSLWQRDHNKKKTIFYLDPTANNIPVKIEQYKNQQLQATLWLKELNWNE